MFNLILTYFNFLFINNKYKMLKHFNRFNTYNDDIDLKYHQ